LQTQPKAVQSASDRQIALDGENRLSLHGMLAGYLERDGSAVVDEQFFGTELNRQLLTAGYRVCWECGVAEKLERQDAQKRAVPPRFAHVYQLHPAVDPTLKFVCYEAALARAGPLSRERYRLVYDGPCPQGDLDDVCDFFLYRPPKNFTGHPLTVSDLLELYSEKEGRLYYINPMGYQPVRFENSERETPGT
jgi:hypothetical protein